jgi:hypothetical protein
VADKKSFFLTGANAKILLNNKTVAFATDVSFRVSVKHASPRVCGRFEVEVHQPLAYDVEGSLTIIKYGRGMKEYLGPASPSDASNEGSGIGSYKKASTLGAIGGALGFPTADGQFDGAADEAFIPARLFQSKMFDIEIRQKVPGNSSVSGNGFFPGPPPGGTTGLAGVQGKALAKASAVGNSLINTLPPEEVPMFLLRDCRFTDLDFRMTKRGVATINMAFKARYMDDDTMIARKSGVGQELS